MNKGSKIVNVSHEFIPVSFSTPLQIGKGKITHLDYAKVQVQIEGPNNEKGRGESGSLLSNIWAFIDEKSLRREEQEKAMRNAVVRICNTPENLSRFENPLQLHLNSQGNIRSYGQTNGLPLLAMDVCLSPFDLAVWQAWADCQGKSPYELLNEPSLVSTFRSIDERFNSPGALFHEPNPSVRYLHTFGANTSISSLHSSIRANRTNAVKIKLIGNVEQDIARIIEVAQTLAEYGSNYCFSVDGNEKYTGANQVGELLEEIRRNSLLERLLYVEQPTSRDLNASGQNMNEVVKEYGVIVTLDEMAADYTSVDQALERFQWKGVALKPTAKVFSQTLLSMAIANYHEAHISVQDLTAPGRALKQQLDFARRAVALNDPVETNAGQYLAKVDREKLMPRQEDNQLYVVRDGVIDTSGIL